MSFTKDFLCRLKKTNLIAEIPENAIGYIELKNSDSYSVLFLLPKETIRLCIPPDQIELITLKELQFLNIGY